MGREFEDENETMEIDLSLKLDGQQQRQTDEPGKGLQQPENSSSLEENSNKKEKVGDSFFEYFFILFIMCVYICIYMCMVQFVKEFYFHHISFCFRELKRLNLYNSYK